MSEPLSMSMFASKEDYLAALEKERDETALTDADGVPDSITNASEDTKARAFEWLRSQDCFYAALMAHEISRLAAAERPGAI